MLKVNLLAISFMLLAVINTNAQEKYYTKTGKIEFFSSAPLEDIEALNKTASAVLDAKTGTLQFIVLMKGFEFEKALMQEHFNSTYVESDKYPKAEFKGSIVNNSVVNYKKDGNYYVKVKGSLSIHGVTKNIEAPGTISVSGGKLNAASVFTIKLSDYNIRIPSAVKNKISNDIKITIDCKLDPLQ